MGDDSAIVRVQVGGASTYDVVIGRGLFDEIPALVGATARQVLLVHPRAMADVVATLRPPLSRH